MGNRSVKSSVGPQLLTMIVGTLATSSVFRVELQICFDLGSFVFDKKRKFY